MKKLLAIVLLLCMVCSSAFALGNLERTETRVVREAKDNGKFDINVFMQVKNTGDMPVSLDKADIYLYDANNTVLDDDSTYSMYPPILQPGEVGYIYDWMYSVEAAIANSISSYSINIAPEHKYLEEIQKVTHTATYAEVPYYNDFDPIVTFTVTNDTAAALWEPDLVVVVRSAEGKILDIQTATMYNVGIPAGSVVLYEMDLGSYNLEAWKAAGHTVGSVETFAYIELD